MRSIFQQRGAFTSSSCGSKAIPTPIFSRASISLQGTRRARVRVHDRPSQLETQTEKFLEELQQQSSTDGAPAPTAEETALRAEISTLQSRSHELKAAATQLQTELDELYRSAFAGMEVMVDEGAGQITERIGQEGISEPEFNRLSKSRPKLTSALLKAKEKDAHAWQDFTSASARLKQQQGRVQKDMEAVEDALTNAYRRLQRLEAPPPETPLGDAVGIAKKKAGGFLAGLFGGGAAAPTPATPAAAQKTCRMVLITGFESFNSGLYGQVARQLARANKNLQLSVFSDRDLEPRRAEIERCLAEADLVFASLLFDYDQVEWLRERIARVPVRLVFESALELMSSTQIGSFDMKTQGGEKRGPPPAVKKVLSLFGSNREEDKLVGYLSFLKVGPSLLKFIPGDKARDLRNWLTAYSYWNQGGLQNVTSMFLFLAQQYFHIGVDLEPAALVETPALGCLHPAHKGYFESPAEFLRWYDRHGAVRDPRAPTAAVLLYRKHVITEQPYIHQMIEEMEAQGVRPVPIFINGVEAHTVVRDLLTTRHEKELLGKNLVSNPTLRRDAIEVDAVINTIGFPLVGGPAGSAIEAGRQSEVAKSILSSKNIPYIVAAPLLIQDMASWMRDGIAGLQSVVLYSLPELDGAIDTVPLGGLVGDNIYLVPERLRRLTDRVKKWVHLRRGDAAKRKVAVVLYGFPPGVGATGTAALLNVPKSLEALLESMRREGYDLGPVANRPEVSLEGLGEALVTALKAFEVGTVINRGAAGVQDAGPGPAQPWGAKVLCSDTPATALRADLAFPSEWGPSEWGPIPFLPDSDVLVKNVERQWGELDKYRGLMTSADGHLITPGIQLGNVWIGVQPLLGVEGDPMRLLFQRDLTPHPQYIAFYKWLERGLHADAVVHMGMHGTVEWLPGQPLGNTGLSWPDVLLSSLPNVYVYAANNPSESIIAKRRGYGTIVSYNVPPYGRAGLYKQLAQVRDLLAEFREDPAAADASLRAPIIESLNQSGLQEDCPFRVDPSTGAKEFLSAESVAEVSPEAFLEYAGRLWAYLQVVENRLFSEGLHVLGAPPSPDQMRQYLAAYFGNELTPEEVDIVADLGPGADVSAVRQRLERMYAAPAASTSSPITSASGSGSPPHAQNPDGSPRLAEALQISRLLHRNTEEIQSVLRALNGEYILPEAGGDLLRDGAGVLPTGRNIHALDPYRMPSQAALERGTKVARLILEAHQAQNAGRFPETVAVNLWGLDAIKTKGESVAIVLHMVGARPVKEGTGRIVRFELVPLAEMGGRPRVDVLCNLSGIFRDSFQNVVELLDDLFQRAADAEEDPEMNFIRKHALAMKSEGLDNTAARLFSNPAGDYGSMVNERVGTSEWENGEELGATWASRNAFSYGRGTERGTARPEVLQNLLKTTERVVQEIDSVEYGLTDIQEYFANTGALKRAAETAKGPGGSRVGCSIVEAFGREAKPRELEDVLRIEYRSKLLNPKWAQAMSDQGSGGAFEISQRMTAMVGWGATVDFAEDWVWDQAAETYALDEEMADKLKKSNPQAFSNVVRRMLEAAGRGMWNADEKTLERLRELYAEMDEELEGVQMIKSSGR